MHSSVHVCLLHYNSFCLLYGKIMEFKGQDKKTTLTHYLISQLHTNDPELLKFPQLMEAVVKAGNADSECINWVIGKRDYDNYCTCTVC